MDGWEDSDSSGGGGWSTAKKAASAAGKSLSKSGAAMSEGAGRNITPVAYKRGGKVRKTGPAILHKDERVVPAGKRKKVERMMKRKGMALTDRAKKKMRGKTRGR